MQIISHRGYWIKPNEKNTATAFKRSFDLGFGTETDIRDFAGELVISHDIPTGTEMSVEEMMVIYKESASDSLLALNIKSDGLQQKIKALLNKYKIKNYFLFDMSVPDAVVSLNAGLICYTRQSEYEREPAFYEQATGVWLDEFYENWITIDQIQLHKNDNKNLCIVSPELHKRDPFQKWEQYKQLNASSDLSSITLCTDLPEKAERLINGKN